MLIRTARSAMQRRFVRTSTSLSHLLRRLRTSAGISLYCPKDKPLRRQRRPTAAKPFFGGCWKRTRSLKRWLWAALDSGATRPVLRFTTHLTASGDWPTAYAEELAQLKSAQFLRSKVRDLDTPGDHCAAAHRASPTRCAPRRSSLGGRSARLPEVD